MTSNASSPTQRHAPAPLSPITTSSNVPPRGHTVRVASDASRSVLSTRSAPSFTSTNATNTYPPSSYASSSTGVPLARRILNHPSRTGAPLPPALSPPPGNKDEHVANDISRLNDEIYDFIALALRGYVTPWYSRLTPRDREFIPEINKAVVAVVQELDRRVRRADLDRLLLVDLPILVTQHYEDFRLARSKLGTSYAAGASLSLSASSAEAQSQTKPSSSSSLPPSAAAENPALAHIFHNIQSHLALNASGEIDDTYLRQAVDHVLKTCLPPQDWASEMERSIVREIIVKPVLGSVLNKLSQPWFLHSILLSLLGSPRASESPTASPQATNPIGSTSLPSSPFKPQHFIILFLTLVQTISTFCLNAIAFFQRARVLVHTVNVAYPYPSSPSPQSSSKTSQPQIPVSAPSIPSSGLPFLTIPQRGTSVPAHHNTPTPTPAPPIDPMDSKEYATSLLEMLATMLTMRKRRASSTFLGMLDWSVGFTEGFLNRYELYPLHFVLRALADYHRHFDLFFTPSSHPGLLTHLFTLNSSNS
ncbi:hypothetical protein DL93DRAFT_2121871 [Clavulina sp. PMI_390]|nr:hypothetical protein DL93DRAFT_2121871 [Clavulina sp. PMI_390]